MKAFLFLLLVSTQMGFAQVEILDAPEEIPSMQPLSHLPAVQPAPVHEQSHTGMGMGGNSNGASGGHSTSFPPSGGSIGGSGNFVPMNMGHSLKLTPQGRENVARFYGSNPGVICHNECKPRRMLLVGPEREFTERKSCNECIDKNVSVSHVSRALNPSRNPVSEPVICPEADNAVIPAGGACFNECKPRREFLGLVGPTRGGIERRGCVECIVKYPNIYRLNAAALAQLRTATVASGNDCIISDNRQIVTCGQDVYKLDTSINQMERVISSERPMSGGSSAGSSGNTSGNGSGSDQ